MSGTNSVRSSRNSSSIKAGAVDYADLSTPIGAFVAPGGVGAKVREGHAGTYFQQYGWIGQVEKIDTQSTVSVHVNLLTAGEGQGEYVLPVPTNKPAQQAFIRIWMSPLDPTDSDTITSQDADAAYPVDNRQKGGGLVPNQIQLERYFTPVLGPLPATGAHTGITKSAYEGAVQEYRATASGADISLTVLAQCTQTFVVVQVLNGGFSYTNVGDLLADPVTVNDNYYGASSLDLRCRIETFLYPTVLKQDANGTATNDDLLGALGSIAQDTTLAGGLLIKGNLGSTPTALQLDSSGYLQTSIAGMGLPTGASTSAKQDTINATLSTANTKLTAIDAATAATAFTPGPSATPGDTVVDQLRELNYKFTTDGTTPVTGHVIVNGETAGNGATGTTATMVYPAVNTTVVQPGPPVVPIGTQIMPQRLSTQTDRIVLQDVNNGERQPVALCGIERENGGGNVNCAMLVTQMKEDVQYSQSSAQAVAAGANAYMTDIADTRGHSGDISFIVSGTAAFSARPAYGNSTVLTPSWHDTIIAAPIPGAGNHQVMITVSATYRYVGIHVTNSGSSSIDLTTERSFKPSAGAWLAY